METIHKYQSEMEDQVIYWYNDYNILISPFGNYIYISIYDSYFFFNLYNYSHIYRNINTCQNIYNIIN